MYIPTVAGYVGVILGRKEMPPAWGLISLVGMAGGAGMGPYVAGALRDATGSYLVACVFVNIAKQPSSEEVWGDK